MVVRTPDGAGVDVDCRALSIDGRHWEIQFRYSAGSDDSAGKAPNIDERTDKYTSVASITPEGLALLRRLDQPVDAADQAMFATLSDDDVERLVDLLNELRGRALESTG